MERERSSAVPTPVPHTSHLPELVAKAGLRVTPQRLALLELLVGQGGHLTADELYQRARAAFPGLSATSIYKSLHALSAAGLIREVHVGTGPLRYDATVGRRHHHRVCRTCGRVDDVACPASPDTECVAQHDLGRFVADQVEVTYRGLCGDCQAPGEPASPTIARDGETR